MRDIKQLVEDAHHGGWDDFEMTQGEAMLILNSSNSSLVLSQKEWQELFKSLIAGTATFYGRTVKLVC